MTHGIGRRAGRFIETTTLGETVRAFLPAPLPPVPPVDLLSLLDRLGRAERALGRLDGITAQLPSHALFLYMYVRKEAVLSSQIEGTQSTLSDLLRFETEASAGRPVDDIREISNYVDAMMYGLDTLKTLPLSLRLLRQLHERLLQSGRGQTKSPGEFRRSQNWIGGTRPGNALFIPPPPGQELDQCLDAFERFIHDDEAQLPALVKAGLLHVQFETIHPFLDGNGRIGRLLVTLFLCMNGVIAEPILYLSLYLKTHRAQYYRLLQEVREQGAWEAWLEFFLDGVIATANQAYTATASIAALFAADRQRIRSESTRAGSSLQVHDTLQRNPYGTANSLVKATTLSAPTVNAALAELEQMGLVREVTGKRRGRVFAYTAYLEILSEGTAALPSPGKADVPGAATPAIG